MKSKDRWTNSRTSVYNIGYHLIWCPKYRRKVLKNNIELRLKELLLEKANEKGEFSEIVYEGIFSTTYLNYNLEESLKIKKNMVMIEELKLFQKLMK